MSRSELKAYAKACLKGNIGNFFLCSLVVTLIGVGCSFVPVIGTIASYIVTAPFMLGMILNCFNALRGEEVNLNTLFSGFNYLGTAVLVTLLMGIFTLLWSLLFFIPGIIKAVSYSMSMYVLAEHPEMKATEAIKTSQQLMQGHKMEYFILMLSFVPWILLSIVTFGIASIYVTPYIQLTTANFYESIKSNKF